jgi:hypothetical protein
MSEQGAEAAEVHDTGVRVRGVRRKARVHAGSEFLGVCWRPGVAGGDKFGARIRESKGKPQTWLGSFHTAEHAARAFDAAAVKMHGAAAVTNFKIPDAVDDGAVSSLLQAQAEPSGHNGRTKFRGVCRQKNGKFGARISKRKVEKWLGVFETAEEAAMAYDAAAINMHGAKAITNFPQPVAVDDGVFPLLAEPSCQGVLRHSSGESIAQVCDRKGKAALSLGGVDSPGMRHDHLFVGVPAAERQQVNELLKDLDSDVSLMTLICIACLVTV